MDLDPCDAHTVSDQPCEGRRDAIVLIRAHQGQEPDSITACTVHAAAARRQCAAGPPFVGGQCPWCGPDHDEPDPGLPCDSHTASDEPCDGIRDAVLLRPDPPFPVTAILDAWSVAAARYLVDLHLFGPWLAGLDPAEREAYEWAEERHAARMRAAGIPGW